MKTELSMILIGVFLGFIIVGGAAYFQYKHVVSLLTNARVVVTKEVVVTPSPTATPSAGLKFLSPKVTNVK